jgi:hypothetical protein
MARAEQIRQQMIRDGQRRTAVSVFLFAAAVLMVAYILMLPLERSAETVMSQRMDKSSPAIVPIAPK